MKKGQKEEEEEEEEEINRKCVQTVNRGEGKKSAKVTNGRSLSDSLYGQTKCKKVNLT